MGWSDIAYIIRRTIEEALNIGRSEAEVYDTLLEDVEFKGESDWYSLWHYSIPEVLKDELRNAGLDCELFFKTQEVPGPEYLANCVTESGEHIALGIDVDVERENETGEVYLDFIQAYRGKWSESQLAYYTSV